MTASEAILMEGLPSRKNRALLDGFVASRAFAFSTFCCDTILLNKISIRQSTNSSLITHQGRFSLPLDLGLQSWVTLEVCRSDCPASSPSLPPSCSQPGWKGKIIVSQSPSWTRYALWWCLVCKDWCWCPDVLASSSSTPGRHNLQSFLTANSTQNYFIIARILSFFVTFATKVPYLTFCDKMRQFLI